MTSPSPQTEPDLTCDAFLGGRLRVRQPQKGFRAGVDAVLLAASVPARPGQSVLELGCGAGVASLCLGARVAGLSLTGVEVQGAYAALARDNAAAAGQGLEVITADLRVLPADLRARSFDQVMMNPPYFQRDAGSAAPDPGRDIARGGDTGLGDWVDTAVRRLSPKGCLTVIQRPERLPDLIRAMDDRLGALELLPLHPRLGQPASLIVLRARKGRRSAMQLCAPLVMHTGLRHADAGDSYSAPVEAALRHAMALSGFICDQ